jgi:hypothetical protein
MYVYLESLSNKLKYQAVLPQIKMFYSDREARNPVFFPLPPPIFHIPDE